MAHDAVSGMRIVGATVIDGTGRPPIRDAVLETRGELIARIAPRRPDAGGVPDDGRLPAPTETLDASGLTLIPGLIDAHAHVALAPDLYRSAADPMAVTDTLLRAFLAAGVTTVRDPGSPDLGPVFRALKAGRPEWPRFVGCGPLIDGPPGAAWAGTRVVTAPAAARTEASRMAAGGADFLKLYFWITKPLVSAVAEVARERGLPVAYHPGELPIDDAIRAGVDQVEHSHHALDLVAGNRAVIARRLGRAGWDNLSAFRLWSRVDPESDRARASVGLMAERGVTFVPTLVLTRTVVGGVDGELAARLGVDAMPPEVRRRWASGVRRRGGPADRRRLPEILARQGAFVRLALAAGVTVAAGTGGHGNHLVPGTSLHEELRLLVDAGLRPMDALVAATGAAARVLGRSAELGTLQAGRLADFVVVRGDPSIDISDVGRIVAVVKGGRIAFGVLPPRPGNESDPGR